MPAPRRKKPLRPRPPPSSSNDSRPSASSTRPFTSAPPSPIDDDHLTILDYPGRVREWNSKWERRLAVFYDPNSPPFIDERQDAVELAAYLDEWAYTCREAGAKSVRGQGLVLMETTTAKDFEQRYAEPWRRKPKAEREEIVLQVLEHVHRGRAAGPARGESMRMLAPEITLEQLAGGKGEGLLKLANSLVVEGWTQERQWSVFVRNKAFERKCLFNFDQDTLLPASKALRAFQEEQRLTRHSYLFEVVLDLFRVIEGKKLVEQGAINYNPREYSATNNPASVANEGRLPELRKNEAVFESCTGCPKTASHLAPKKFLYCSKCLSAGRHVPWCSSECMKANFKLGVKHKDTCGQTLKDASAVPLFSSPATSSRPLNQHLQVQFRSFEAFNAEAKAIWFFSGRMPDSGRLFQAPLYVVGKVGDAFSTTQQQTERMMAIRDSAIHQRDDKSLGILLGYLLECPDVMWGQKKPAFVRDFGGAKRDPKPDVRTCTKVERAELQRQLLAAFEITEEKLNELIEVGREALKESGRDVERTTWRNAMSFRQDHERRRDLYDRGQAGEFVIEDSPSLRDMPECMKEALKFIINIATGHGNADDLFKEMEDSKVDELD
ncbi:hypothetical protein BCR35DRAFT_329415 [Leucosporidium creatinivorum]|uniref:MYND-type domain-containing protein n=1 Tax=Leucosporidium creatinivorum TaxID=106004 RepID=A0A1Y2G3F0_9BASI|nr:hypothetical protein BCR35DRAFT_329415 [Leucosporidium creatinivorum]